MKCVLESLLVLAFMSTLSFAGDAPKKVHEIKFENKLVDGKKTWTPARHKVKVGEHVKITFVNTLGEDHGAEIPGLVTAMVVSKNASSTAEFDATTEGEYAVKCQLHPAHVAAVLIVKK